MHTGDMLVNRTRMPPLVLVPFIVSIWPARSPEVIMWVMTKVQLQFVPWG